MAVHSSLPPCSQHMPLSLALLSRPVLLSRATQTEGQGQTFFEAKLRRYGSKNSHQRGRRGGRTAQQARRGEKESSSKWHRRHVKRRSSVKQVLLLRLQCVTQAYLREGGGDRIGEERERPDKPEATRQQEQQFSGRQGKGRKGKERRHGRRPCRRDTPATPARDTGFFWRCCDDDLQRG